MRHARNEQWKDYKGLLEYLFFPGRWIRLRDSVVGRNPPPAFDTIENEKVATTQHAPSDLSFFMALKPFRAKKKTFLGPFKCKTLLN
jgi:hypothetical protein